MIARWVALLIGAGAAILGLLPWLVTGMRMPLQNLWVAQTPTDQLPLVLLPFSQYAITLIIALLVVGGGIAGIVARTVRRRLRKGGVLAVALGALAVQLFALLQTAITVRAGLQDRTESTLYLAALVGVAALSIAVGMLVLVLIAKAPRAGAVMGLAISAVAFGPWIGGLLSPLGTVPGELVVTVLGAVRWIPPILVGAAIAWGGINTIGRVLAALLGLALVWLVPALTTAIFNAAGSRVLAEYPAQMLEYGLQVFGMAATMPALAVPPVLVTVIVATIGLIARKVLLRSRRREPVVG